MGFSMGTFVGIIIEQKLAIGIQVLKIITNKDADKLCLFLNAQISTVVQCSSIKKSDENDS